MVGIERLVEEEESDNSICGVVMEELRAVGFIGGGGDTVSV